MKFPGDLIVGGCKYRYSEKPAGRDDPLNYRSKKRLKNHFRVQADALGCVVQVKLERHHKKRIHGGHA
jgi:hypothetical protein